MATYTTRIRPTGHSLRFGLPLKGILPTIRIKRGMLFGVMMFIALIAFEIFNYSTTEYALTDLLSNLQFAGVRWSTILALAFCGMDFAGIARLLTPEDVKEHSMEVWYLLGAWLLAATINAMLTWWAVSLALLNHNSLGNELISREALLSSVPVFIALLVWLIRVLMIGIFTLAGTKLNPEKDVTQTNRPESKITRPKSMGASIPGGLNLPANHRPIHPAPKTMQDS
ncbi:MAG: hypothetical protein A2Z14_08150 [Chloroflexi bacterium RBG_16_48_8]|nr:MAG: hypothetical protein A2Z14_08150 [Chloroflexi bacterium RBG_16_48_8]